MRLPPALRPWPRLNHDLARDTQRPARRLRGALAADRAPWRGDRRVARRVARLALDPRAGGAGTGACGSGRVAWLDDLALELARVDRLRCAARRPSVADFESDPRRRRHGHRAACLAFARLA